MTNLTTLQTVAILLLPILLAITVHEAAHGWVAHQLGDNTAFRAGRVTLNPIKHIDLIGTIILPLLLSFLGGFIFGWAKPVPVNFHNLRQPRRDTALVALAGPMANLVMAIGWAVIAKAAWLMEEDFTSAIFLVYMGQAGTLINSALMILNLVPILPLDGGRILHSMLPPNLATPFGRLEPYGLYILIGLLISGVLAKILYPLWTFVTQQLLLLVGFKELVLQQ
jgi:Zn-dependent protease